MPEETTPSPQDANEKKPNAPVTPWPPTDFFPGFTGAAAVPVIKPIEPVVIPVPAPRPVPCRIFNREPTGTRRRGLKCETCGAQADMGETIVCAQ